MGSGTLTRNSKATFLDCRHSQPFETQLAGFSRACCVPVSQVHRLLYTPTCDASASVIVRDMSCTSSWCELQSVGFKPNFLSLNDFEDPDASHV